MPGIYLAALVCAGLALLIYGLLLRRLPGTVERRWLLSAFLIALPLQPLAFFALRLPLMTWLKHLLHVTLPDVNVPFPEMSTAALTYVALSTLFAPVTEELAKATPLLLAGLRKDIRPENLARYALAIGLGFGLGEIGFVAAGIARNPELASLPAYAFGAFVAERLMVCLNHAAFVACTLRWRAGILLAILAHWAGNLPIFLPGSHPWLLAAWVQLYFLGSLAWITTLAYGSPRKLGLLLMGRARCPECQTIYDRSIWALNAGAHRYERCPACRHWHWTGPKDEV